MKLHPSPLVMVYCAHPLSALTRAGMNVNRAHAAKWAKWLWEQGFAVECFWIVCTGELEETPENRELGLRSDCEQASRCDAMALCGPRISSGMLREAGAAKLIVDFTRYGLELPRPTWSGQTAHRGQPPSNQELVAAWIKQTLGEESAANGPERSLRLVEEAVELAQVLGIEADELPRLVDYVFSRPVGNVSKEIAGCQVTLYGVASAVGVNVEHAFDKELVRIHQPEIIERVRRRQKEKREVTGGGK